jgi:hypothetical protein
MQLQMKYNPRQRDRVLAQHADDSVVLLDLDGGEYFTLNEVGSRVWELCDGSHSILQMIAILAEEYDAPEHEIERDVERLLAELADEKLVVFST